MTKSKEKNWLKFKGPTYLDGQPNLGCPCCISQNMTSPHPQLAHSPLLPTTTMTSSLTVPLHNNHTHAGVSNSGLPRLVMSKKKATNNKHSGNKYSYK